MFEDKLNLSEYVQNLFHKHLDKYFPKLPASNFSHNVLT